MLSQMSCDPVATPFALNWPNLSLGRYTGTKVNETVYEQDRATDVVSFNIRVFPLLMMTSSLDLTSLSVWLSADDSWDVNLTSVTSIGLAETTCIALSLARGLLLPPTTTAGPPTTGENSLEGEWLEERDSK